MSDTMLLAVLRMPINGRGDIHLMQFIARAREAAERIERDAAEMERLRKTLHLAERCARAKGRYHSQHAHCDLMEHFGVPCVRPGEDKPYHASELPKVWELYRHHNGGLYRVEMVTNVESNRAEYPVTVCYRGEDGRVWSKTLSEFLAKMTRAEDPG